jgi:hypothetical protein
LTLLVLALVAIATILSSRSWRRGLEWVLILVVLEGAIRKWVAPGAASYVYFAKDFLILGVYSGYLRDPARRRLHAAVAPGLGIALGIAAAIALLQIFNPQLPSPLVGVLGFKAYFLYVPLLWVVPAAFRDADALKGWMRRYLLLSIPVGALAAAQFFSPPDSALNTYARGGTETGGDIITFGAVERVRVTGTFSFITGYSSYLQVISLLALSALTLRSWRFRGSLMTYAGFAMTVMGMLMSGSRGPVFLMILILPIYWVFGVARAGGVPAVGRFLLGAGLVASIVNVSAFRARAAGSSDVAGRILLPFINPLRILPDIGFLGYGTGATHQMAEVVAPSLFPYSWLEGHHYEDEPSRVMVELGPVGFLAFFAARLGLVTLAMAALFRVRGQLERSMVLSSLLLFLAQLTGGVVFNVTAGVYYWFFGGLLFLALRFDRESRLAAQGGAPGGVGGPVVAGSAGRGRSVTRPA